VSQAKRRQTGFYLVIMIIIPWLLVACVGPLEPSNTPTPTSEGLPEFLSYVYPRPGLVVLQRQASLRNGRWVTVDIEKITELDASFDSEHIQDHLELLLDGAPVDITVLEDPLAKRPRVDVYASPMLALGPHTATVRVPKTTGGSLEFSWAFEVVDRYPSQLDLPLGFIFVRPAPDSVVGLDAYREESLIPEYVFPDYANLEGGVCVGIVVGAFVEAGEFLNTEDVFAKYGFISLDGAAPSRKSDIVGEVELVEMSVVDAAGRKVASYPGPQSYKCWKVDLAPGEHEAKVEVRMASGNIIEYSWRFSIARD
jgi:hypothetical protein